MQYERRQSKVSKKYAADSLRNCSPSATAAMPRRTHFGSPCALNESPGCCPRSPQVFVVDWWQLAAGNPAHGCGLHSATCVARCSQIARVMLSGLSDLGFNASGVQEGLGLGTSGVHDVVGPWQGLKLKNVPLHRSCLRNGPGLLACNTGGSVTGHCLLAGSHLHEKLEHQAASRSLTRLSRH